MLEIRYFLICIELSTYKVSNSSFKKMLVYSTTFLCPLLLKKVLNILLYHQYLPIGNF